MPKESVRERTESRLKEPKRYKVLMYNDDYTPMDFVVAVLQQIFDKNKNDAVGIMMEIHNGTFAVVGVYSRDIARTKANTATEWARSEGYPLKVEAVEA